jgi:aromatic ring-opening dioxygenase catalytic subunit (LigB family)
MPTIYITHGGGPCFWITPPEPFGPNAFDGLKAYLSGLLDTLPARPKAFLVISGHWEETLPTIGSAENPEMIFDYYGFPKHTYQLEYPAPGSPELAAEVANLFTAAGLHYNTDDQRGYDHGVFVPFLIIDPESQIPVVTLSLRQDLDPVAHIEIGKALEPLRDQGVLIVGSGSSYHNLRRFIDGEAKTSQTFDHWLTKAIVETDESTRNDLLCQWSQAPGARMCHPREDHLIPLMVAAGAAGTDTGARVFHDSIAGKAFSGFSFG